MSSGKIPYISGYIGAVAVERQHYTLKDIARLKGWSPEQFQFALAKELHKFCQDWGPLLQGESEELISGGVGNIASGLIELAQRIDRDEEGLIVNVLRDAVVLHHQATALHQERVKDLAFFIGDKLGIYPGRLSTLQTAASLHDVGKLAVPVKLLDKAGPLTTEESDLVKRVHLLFGYNLLKAIPFLQGAAGLVGFNHYYDGYQPSSHLGRPLPLEAQILSAADFYDALIEQRGYRNGSDFTAAEALKTVAGRSYDRSVLSAMAAVI